MFVMCNIYIYIQFQLYLIKHVVMHDCACDMLSMLILTRKILQCDWHATQEQRKRTTLPSRLCFNSIAYRFTFHSEIKTSRFSLV